MSTETEDDKQQATLLYKKGDVIRVVQGVDTGRTGEIVDVYPESARPYVVKLGDGWYVHFAEDRLAPADQQT